MRAQNDHLRAEMEVNPRLQNAIAVHHIVQVVSPVVIIIYEIESKFFPGALTIFISAIVPTSLFIIFWIASKCSYKDWRLIIVHFNPLLSTLWFLIFVTFYVITSYDRISTNATIIIIAFLSLSSAMFATYGIWKSARNVVLSERRVNRENNDVFSSIPPTVESPSMNAENNVIRPLNPIKFNQYIANANDNVSLTKD